MGYKKIYSTQYVIYFDVLRQYPIEKKIFFFTIYLTLVSSIFLNHDQITNLLPFIIIIILLRR
jgi:hypothetical protein